MLDQPKSTWSALLDFYKNDHKVTRLGIGQRYSCWKGDTLNDWSNWLVNEVRLQLWCFALFPLDWPHPVHRQWLVIATKKWRWNAKKRNTKRNKQKIQKMHNILFAFLPTPICSMPPSTDCREMQAVSFGSLGILRNVRKEFWEIKISVDCKLQIVCL